MTRFLGNTILMSAFAALALSIVAISKADSTLEWVQLLMHNRLLAAQIGGAILVAALLATWAQSDSSD